MKLRRIGAFALCAVLLALALAGCSGGKKPVILVVSFGTSYNDSREATIGAIEAAMEIIAGTARSMGVRIEGREMKKKYVASRKLAEQLRQLGQ